MKTRLVASPWINPSITEETIEALELVKDDVWKEASVLFAAERDTKQRAGKSAPKGIDCLPSLPWRDHG